MKGNPKIAFTAEAVAFMRADLNSDRFSKYFVNPEIRKKFRFVGKFIPRYLHKIAVRRSALSESLDKVIKEYNPDQIIELASGYSPRGLILTQKNPELIYIETDFSQVIKRKKEIIMEIEKGERIKLSKNHHLVYLDAIGSDPYASVRKLVKSKKRTLIVAETLTSYLNSSEHEVLIRNIKELLDHIGGGAYLSHEGMGMLSGILGKLLLFYRDKIAKTRSYHHFNNISEIKDYFLERSFTRVKTLKDDVSMNIIYLVTKS